MGYLKAVLLISLFFNMAEVVQPGARLRLGKKNAALNPDNIYWDHKETLNAVGNKQFRTKVSIAVECIPALQVAKWYVIVLLGLFLIGPNKYESSQILP